MSTPAKAPITNVVNGEHVQKTLTTTSAIKNGDPSSTSPNGHGAPHTVPASLHQGYTNEVPMAWLFRRLSLPISLILENTGSVARDHLANERTWLAYVRTSLSIASTGVGMCSPKNQYPRLGLILFTHSTRATVHHLRVDEQDRTSLRDRHFITEAGAAVGSDYRLAGTLHSRHR